MKVNSRIRKLLKTIGEILIDQPYDQIDRRQALDDLRKWLTQTDNKQVKRTLIEFIGDSDPTVRCAAIDEALKWNALLSDGEIMAKILPELYSEYEYIRGTILYGLYSYDITDNQMIESLKHTLQYDSSPDVRHHAASLLGRSKNASAKLVLEQARDNDFEKNYEGITVSQSAESALRELGMTK